MEFGLREWMILISGLLIIVVIVDGVRRMLADRRNHIRMGMSYGDDGEDDDYFDEQNPELPNGGARIVNHRTGSTSEPVIGSLDIDEKEFLSRQRVTASMADAVGRAQRADGFESLSALRDLDVDPLALGPAR